MAFALPTAVLAQGSPRIEVQGADDALRDNILSHVGMPAEACDASLVRLQRLLPRLTVRVRDAARALGYYQSSQELRFATGNGCWTLHIAIEPGPPVVLDEVRVEVLAEPAERELFAEVLEANPLRPGQRLDQGVYEQFKGDFSTVAVENGFFAARFAESEIRLDLVDNTADIVLLFDPGDRYVFGDIDIEAGGALADGFLRRLVPFDTGDPYSSASLVELRRNLDASRYFNQIAISPQLGEAEGRQVPLEIDLGLRPRHAYSVGIGFTTDTGPRVRLDYENRYVNSRGHQVGGDAAVSPVRSHINGSYRLPLGDPAYESVDFSGGFVHEDTATFESNRYVVETAYRNESRSGWSRNVFVNYQRDDYQLGVEEASRVLTMLGANLSRTRADNLIHPTVGWRLFAEIRGASDALLSDVSFLQLYSSAKGVLSVSDRSRFIARLETGTTWVDDVASLPVSARFFAGGDQSLRGYKYQAVGPRNEAGEVVGGKSLLVGSVEYDFSFRPNWSLAVFFDSGNAYNDPGDFSRRDALGFGVRWLSPIGPIRADIAHGFDSDDSVRLHITMGPDL